MSITITLAKLKVIKNLPHEAVVRLTEVKDCDEYLEEKMAGWIEGAYKI